MARYIEDFIPPIKEDGIVTAKAVTLGSTLAVTGAITATGAIAANGGINVTGGLDIEGGLTGEMATEVVTATNVITAAESGKVFFLNSATEFVSTLPAPVAGAYFKFIVKAAPSGASYTVVTTGGANIIQGAAEVANSAVAAIDEDTITFTDGAAAVGDWVEVVSDGTNWYVSGHGVAATAIAFTAT